MVAHVCGQACTSSVGVVTETSLPRHDVLEDVGSKQVRMQYGIRTLNLLCGIPAQEHHRAQNGALREQKVDNYLDKTTCTPAKTRHYKCVRQGVPLSVAVSMWFGFRFLGARH